MMAVARKPGRKALTPGGIGQIGAAKNADTGEWHAWGRARLLTGGYAKRERTARTEKAARDAVEKALRDALGFQPGANPTLTPDSAFSELVEAWIEEEDRTQRNGRRTRADQHHAARRNLVSVLGRFTVREITAPVCDQALHDLLAPRRKLKGRAVELPADAAERQRRERKAGVVAEDPGTVRKASARNDLLILRKVMDKAVRAGLRTDNPAEAVELPRREKKEIRYSDPAGFRVIRDAVDRYDNRPGRLGPKPSRDLGDVMDIGTLGLRVGEILGLRLSDLDLSTPTVTLAVCGTVVEAHGVPKHRQEWTKGKRSYRIEASKYVDSVIRARLVDPSVHSKVFLFETSTGAVLGPEQLRRSWRNVRNWAGLPDYVTPHLLRKSSVTATRQAKGLDAASLLANHQDPRVTRGVYDGTSLVPYAITEALEQFGPAQDRGASGGSGETRVVRDADRALVERTLSAAIPLWTEMAEEARAAILAVTLARIG